MKKGTDYIGSCIIFFCHDGEGNVLLAKRSVNSRDEHGNWDIGGGAIEFGEHVEEVLRREIKEEYCTDILDHEFLGFRDVHRVQNGIPTHWISLDFKVKVDRSTVQIGEPHKFDEIGWFRLDSLPSPVHSQFPYFLEQYKERLSI